MGPGGGRAAAPQSDGKFSYSPGEGGRPDRPARPQQDRPARPAGAQGAARGPKRGAASPFGVELTPTVEKEKVSNYDPNKKAYERPPEIDKKVKPKK
jgi:translation initiation factor IF-2